MKTSVLLIIGTILFAACNVNTEDKKAGIEGMYEIDIPYYFSFNEQESDDSLKVYQNIFRDIHFSVFHIGKEELGFYENDSALTETAFQLFLLSMYLAEDDEMKYDEQQDENYKQFEVNGLEAMQGVLTGVIEDINFHMTMTIISGRKNFYQIISSTRTKEKEKYTEDFDRMIKSFQEL